MTDQLPPFQSSSDQDPQRKLMYIIYGLFGLGILFGGMPTIAGVIVAYIKKDELFGSYYYDHIQFLIRTFWGSMVGMLIGILLVFLFVGVAVIWAISIWYMFRVIYGFIKLMDNKSVTPTGWFM